MSKEVICESCKTSYIMEGIYSGGLLLIDGKGLCNPCVPFNVLKEIIEND